MTKDKEIGTFLFFRDSAELRKRWPFFLCMGILLIVLGILAIIYSKVTTVVAIDILGIFLLIGGIFLFINAYQGRKWKGAVLIALLGVLSIVIGGICIAKPHAAASAATLLLAAFFLLGGLFRMITALAYRFDYSGLWFLNGLVAFILGIIIVTQWPLDAFWVLGLFIGIDLIMNGCSWVAVSLAAKRSGHL